MYQHLQYTKGFPATRGYNGHICAQAEAQVGPAFDCNYKSMHKLGAIEFNRRFDTEESMAW